MTKEKANCFKAVIVGEMKTAYWWQAYATGAAYDCQSYGNNDPNSEACQRKSDYTRSYLEALTQLGNALEKCNGL